VRRGLVCLALAAVLMIGTACGAKQADAAEEQQTLTGTLDEVKSFMFVVTDDQNSAYVFSTEEGNAPQGLADVSVGDRVTVTYTGTLSELDGLDGTVVSVEAAE
jgi:FKBP-type peptidyl-prolyl cis-trans isomerase